MRNLVILLLMLLSVPALSYFPATSLNGATGLTRIPDAHVVPYKNWNLSIDLGTAHIAGNQQPAFMYKANLGAFHNFELGLVGGLDQQGQQMRDGVYVNLKYSPAIGDGSDPLLLAIGVENLASLTQTGVYMVATKPFKQGPLLSFGFMADFPNNKFRPLGMAGLEFPLGNLSILGDLFAGESVFQVNGGVRLYLLSDFCIEGRAVNIAGNNQAAQNVKDPQMYTFSFSWLNPF